ncbi:MAG: Uma2 family endonuclease [Acidobacteria bacterium]|nr:Uma2 family endonuclease [Acidobacteriota bacterium]
MTLLALNVRSLRLTDDQFLRLCRDNSDSRFEMTAQGELIIMPPVGGEAASQESIIIQRLGNWSEKDGTGICFSSSAGFVLPNGAKRSPDASWILKARWNELPKDERRKLPHLCPDFVVELRLPSDRRSNLHKKMEEYLANGARLGWLLDPTGRTATVYRPGEAAQCLKNPATISGDPVLPGFQFDFQELL